MDTYWSHAQHDPWVEGRPQSRRGTAGGRGLSDRGGTGPRVSPRASSAREDPATSASCGRSSPCRGLRPRVGKSLENVDREPTSLLWHPRSETARQRVYATSRNLRRLGRKWVSHQPRSATDTRHTADVAAQSAMGGPTMPGAWRTCASRSWSSWVLPGAVRRVMDGGVPQPLHGGAASLLGLPLARCCAPWPWTSCWPGRPVRLAQRCRARHPSRHLAGAVALDGASSIAGRRTCPADRPGRAGCSSSAGSRPLRSLSAGAAIPRLVDHRHPDG